MGINLCAYQYIYIYKDMSYSHLYPLRRRRCFSVDSKSFKIEEAGFGKKVRIFITERRWGRMSWIRFGVEGARTLLKSVVSLRTEVDKNIEGL